MGPTDDSLAQRAKSDKAAFKDLYERWVKPVYRYFLHRVNNVKEAEDLTSQVFLKVCEQLPNYRENGRFPAWLFTIVRHQSADHFRSKPPVVPLAEETLPAEALSPLEHATRTDDLQQLKPAANETLAEFGIEIAPAPADQSDGPGGWVFVGDPPYTMDPAEDPYLLVRQTLEQNRVGPWTFYIDLPDPAAIDQRKIEVPEPTPTPTPVGSQTQSDVTVTLDWVFVDALRASAGYTITGLPEEPEALELLGLIYFRDTHQDRHPRPAIINP